MSETVISSNDDKTDQSKISTENIIKDFFYNNDEEMILTTFNDMDKQFQDKSHFISQAIVCSASLTSMFIGEDSTKVNGFMSELKQKSDIEFFRTLRITKGAFALLVKKAEEVGIYFTEHGGRPSFPIETSIAIALWYIGHACPYKDISQQFGVGFSTCHHHIERVIDFLNQIAPIFINWPKIHTIEQKEEEFMSLAGFPGAIGAVDGFRVKMRPPLQTQKDYLDKNNKYSVNVLAVCDAKKRFTFVYAGFPGSAHIQRVFSVSSLGQQLEENPDSLHISDYYHLIGDNKFLLRNYLMVPFKDYGALTTHQQEFNTKLSMTYMVIQEAVACLKARFGRLKYIDADLPKIGKIITAACVLHNICLGFEDEQYRNELMASENYSLETDEEDNGIAFCLQSEALSSALNKQKAIANAIQLF